MYKMQEDKGMKARKVRNRNERITSRVVCKRGDGMRKFIVWLNTGFSGCNIEEIIELPDDLTDEEIEEACKDEAFQTIDWGYEEVAE